MYVQISFFIQHKNQFVPISALFIYYGQLYLFLHHTLPMQWRIQGTMGPWPN